MCVTEFVCGWVETVITPVMGKLVESFPCFSISPSNGVRAILFCRMFHISFSIISFHFRAPLSLCALVWMCVCGWVCVNACFGWNSGQVGDFCGYTTLFKSSGHLVGGAKNDVSVKCSGSLNLFIHFSNSLERMLCAERHSFEWLCDSVLYIV